MKKIEFRTIAEKNRNVKNIIVVSNRLESFLLIGHKDPDADCIAAQIAFSLLLRRLEKTVVIFLPMPVTEQFNYLLAICKYNGVSIVYGGGPIPEDISAIVILDTPKPEMIARNAAIDRLLADSGIRKIEIDHHLGTDAAYLGDPGYCLVSEASSTCELIGYLCFKFSRYKDMFPGTDFFSRNIALAVLTGVVGDSHMGEYLKSSKERRYYNLLSHFFDRLLVEKPQKNGNTIASVGAIFEALYRFSVQEKQCFDHIIQQRHKSQSISYTALGKEESAELFARYGGEVVATISKLAADTLAEEIGGLGLVAYYDDPSLSNFVQFRLRRSAAFTAVDLRTLLKPLGISNGGGHPGAIGFRTPKEKVSDIHAFTADMVKGMECMLSGKPVCQV
jgi:nanoRNase/pAp phosphatase (c-di-AMP/oligoRNAs hydrolase)